MTRIIATICYWLQLHRLAYFFNRKRKRIVTFHNVIDDDIYIDNVANGVSNSFSQFKTIINEIRKRFTISNDLNDSSTLTITFDDGYSNQVDVAGEWLMSERIPAIIFVCGKFLDENDEHQALTIDYLLHWIAFVPEGIHSLNFKGRDVVLEVTSSNRTEIWSTQIWPAFLNDAASKGKDLLDALSSAYSLEGILSKLPPKYLHQRLTPVTENQLRKLKQNGWEIGWHCYSHYPLSGLSTAQKRTEIERNNAIYSSNVISYPYGGIREVDAESVEIASATGYSDGVSNIVDDKPLCGKMFRSRMGLSSDKVLLHFELSGLKYLLKNRRLLPKW